MVSFTPLDYTIIIGFFVVIILAGFIPRLSGKKDPENFLLSGRKVGLTLFVITNVATWYGGILGVGEFSFRYGIASWFTQGFPYYIFALVFALFFAKKIREASLFTIPDKLEETYGKKVGVISGILIFILVSPAPYLLMAGNLIRLVFDIPLFWSLIIAVLLSASYLIWGGFSSDLITDVVGFIVMFGGFIVVFIFSVNNFGGIEFLTNNLPESHLELTGGTSSIYIAVWFLIALWTFTDPGFHQRCYAAKSGKVAVKGIIISIIFWAFFDFLTNTTGLYSKAVLKDIDNPVLAFPLYAEKVLGTGLKGIFYAAMFATIISTLNSFLFLSATTFGKDLIPKIKKFSINPDYTLYTRIGLAVTSLLAILLSLSIESVIDIWYTIGSICIPGLILPVIGAYYSKLRVSSNTAFSEIIISVGISLLWYLIRPEFAEIPVLNIIEPMIFGLIAAVLIHFYNLKNKNTTLRQE